MQIDVQLKVGFAASVTNKKPAPARGSGFDVYGPSTC